MSPFSGVEVDALSAGGIRYSTSVFPPHFVTVPHVHAEAYFCFVLDGASAQRSGGAERLRTRDRAYFYPAGEEQSERFGGSGSRLFSVRLSAAALAELREATRLPRSSSELAGTGALILRRLARASPDDPLEGSELTMRLVGALAHEHCTAIRWAPMLRDYLHAHFRSKPTLQEIARVAGLHPVHLCRAFPRRFGVTIGGYLRALRVDYAARELAATERTIADVALDAGFSSQAHLTREFKRLLGCTPAAYRRR